MDYCISDVKLLREGCLTFRREFREQTGFCPFDKMAIAGACLQTIASTAWRKTPSPPNLSRDGDSSPITPRPLWNGCCGKNIGCRRKTRFETNVFSMLATKANTGSLVDVGGWTASSHQHGLRVLGLFLAWVRAVFPQSSRTVPRSRRSLYG